MMSRLVFTPLARRILGYLGGALGILLLIASAAWWYGESQWGEFHRLTPKEAFADGDFGLQLAPLKYFLVAQTVSRTALGNDWVAHFGFLRRPDAVDGMCVKDAPRNLPVGFSVSNRLQGSATPVPIKFVGFTCAACHAARAGKAGIVIGAGTETADVIGFGDAYINAVLDPSLTPAKILDAYRKQCPGEEGFVQRQVDSFFIGQWLDALRTQLLANAAMDDMPFHGNELADPADVPTGPSRTRPFRSVVRDTLGFPDAGNVAYSKVPLAASQGWKKWSQYDGSIGDPIVRSVIAVFTSGASVPAINNPQIADNVRQASEFTIELGTKVMPLPTLAQGFPNRPTPSPSVLERGRVVYMQQCNSCHGHPVAGGWRMPPGMPDPPISDVGTDMSRLNFRYAGMMVVGLGTVFPLADIAPQEKGIARSAAAAAKAGDLATAQWWQQRAQGLELMAREFPAGHRLAYPQRDLARRHGYEDAPIPGAWLRAPYLHNGSVPTMRELIGLDPRPSRFCRGTAGYDPGAMGIVAPPPGPKGCGGKTYFLFETSQPGNSNAGHWFPKPGAVSRADLEALLAYVGTL
jgi:RoxA-like, cytochrome c-like